MSRYVWPELVGIDRATTTFRIHEVKDQRVILDPVLLDLRQLTFLDLSGVGLRKLDDQVPTSISDNDEILTLPSVNRSLPSTLRDLLLSNNSLGPDITPEGALFGLTRLRSLNLEGNALMHLPSSLATMSCLQVSRIR